MITEPERVARSARDIASRNLARGMLCAFDRGYAQGRMHAAEGFAHSCDTPQWIMIGIRNEIEFLCHRAHELGQK